jgi:transcriptional regulator with XRE-family HTH domain
MIGAWVKAERERRGWSQSELARRAGLTPQAIGQLERSRRRHPYPETVEGLAQAFGVTAEALYRAAYGDLAPETSDLVVEASPMGVLDNWVKRIVALGPELTPAERIAVLEHAVALYDRHKRES